MRYLTLYLTLRCLSEVRRPLAPLCWVIRLLVIGLAVTGEPFRILIPDVDIFE